jgi:hypothetical protein
LEKKGNFSTSKASKVRSHWGGLDLNFLKGGWNNPGKDFTGFLPHWTNSIFILQQLKRNFWKITDVLFRISRMTNSFK